MGALTRARASSIKEVTRERRPLAADAKVFKGGLAVAIVAGTSRGFYKQGAAAGANQRLVAVGRFMEDVDNTGGADGALFADIHFLRERHVFLLANDTGTAVVAADRESACQVLDDQTVTGAVGTNGFAGIVYDVTTEGVWVEIGGGAADSDGTADPAIQSGTNTLASGTKTITGVVLTASSRIFICMKDPGAGAITGMAGFDAPVASRNTSTGQFVVNAIDDSKATISTAVCTFDWMIVG